MPFLAPIIPAVVAFASTTLGSIVISTAISVGVGLLQGIINRSDQPKQKPVGVTLTVQTGDTSPLSFPLGNTATAGKRRYIGTWGGDDNTPNAYLAEVLIIADFPTTGNPTIWGNTEKYTVDWNATPTEQGYPITSLRTNGTDYAWIRVYTGAQTSADTYLTNKFAERPNWPWTSTHIGYGLTYVIVTTLYNRDVFPNGKIDWLFEPAPVALYDLRKDSSNGGNGSHRWGDLTTYEASNNPVIGIYNIIRGMYDANGNWFWGGRNLPAFRLPSASVIAAANVCDVAVDLAAGGTEPQFRCGIEITVDQQPLDVIKDLLQGCNGRLCETGGIFEFLVGAPGAAVYSFTDDNIVIDRSQAFTPFPGLQSSYNGIEATYPEPAERWISKDAPARYNSAWEDEDGGRRLVASIQFDTVPFGTQVQRLMQALISDDRRWRVHQIVLPPDAWVLTGTCTVAWTSAANGYNNKSLLVDRVDGEPGMMQTVTLREVDPTDNDWSTALELPVSTGVMASEVPPAQPMNGWQAIAYTIFDNSGIGRRPGIKAVYSAGLVDITDVRVQVKLATAADDDLIYEGTAAYGAPYYVIIPAQFTPNTQYKVRGILIPGGARPTSWSDWVSVTTPDIKLGVLDIDTTDISTAIAGLVDYVGPALREVLRQAQDLATQAADETLANYSEHFQIRTDLKSQHGTITAEYTEAITVATGPSSAIASRITTLESTVNDDLVSAVQLLQTEIGDQGDFADAITSLSAGTVGGDVSTANFRMTASAGPAGYASRIAFEARAGGTGGYRAASLWLDVPTSESDPTRVGVDSDQFVISTNGVVNALFTAGQSFFQVARIPELDATKINVTNLAAISGTLGNVNISNANIGTLMVGTSNITSGVVLAMGSDIQYAQVNANIDGTTWTDLNTVIITPNNGKTTIQAMCYSQVGSNVSFSVDFRITKTVGGVETELASMRTTLYSGWGPYFLNWDDNNPGTATATYKFQCKTAIFEGGFAFQSVARTLRVQNYKV